MILGLLHEGAATGGDIVALAERRLAAQGGVTRSQVYRELPVLVQRGLVELAPADDPGCRRGSQSYAITDFGRAAFAGWSEAPVPTDHVRSAAVLRLGFGAYLSPYQRRRIVESARAERELALAEHEQWVKDLRSDGDEFAAVAAQFAVDYDRAFLAWLDKVPLA